MSKEAIAIYGAVGPGGRIIKQSIGTFQAIAKRYADNYKNFTVKKLGELELDMDALTVEPVRRGPGRPRKYPIQQQARPLTREEHAARSTRRVQEPRKQA